MSSQSSLATSSPADKQDVDDIMLVRLWRVFNDPVIYHGRSGGYEGYLPDWIYDAIIVARIQRAFETPPSEKITHATWPELAAHLGSATGDAGAINGKFVAAYGHSISQAASVIGVSLDGDALTEIAEKGGPSWRQQNVSDFIDTLRQNIQKSLDKRFLKAAPDILDDVSIPRSRWNGGFVLENNTEDKDTKHEEKPANEIIQSASLEVFA
ncbi:hypothetical protein RH831_10720 [Halodesulfurarchaeum sp. HSR-GB]|uniref:hypothetical protein n=1 Tax=Halodesulfurarchaeum sp. HSR-GB TaxID=3074077 RepID=UPI00285BD186|nr:hypothetical protein [Halodesulfurarchaeum sp. HSR-GB]MDR5657648.1 hypothetical protein [Halodesulfurarchaeum sp. HSR-GB]